MSEHAEVELFDIPDGPLSYSLLFCREYNSSDLIQEHYHGIPMDAFKDFTSRSLPSWFWVNIITAVFDEYKQGNKKPLRQMTKNPPPGTFTTFIDTETSGLYTDSKVIQLAYIVRYIIGDICKDIFSYSEYINWPNLRISSKAIKIHGITSKILRDYGLHPKSVFKLLCYIAKLTERFVAFNAHFDQRMINNSCPQRYVSNIAITPWKCCMKMCGMRINLSAAYMAATGVSLTNAHDALADVQAMIAIYDKINLTGKLSR